MPQVSPMTWFWVDVVFTFSLVAFMVKLYFFFTPSFPTLFAKKIKSSVWPW